MKVKRSGDLSVIVILRCAISTKHEGLRKTIENMFGMSCWSMVDVRMNVSLGGK